MENKDAIAKMYAIKDMGAKKPLSILCRCVIRGSVLCIPMAPNTPNVHQSVGASGRQTVLYVLLISQDCFRCPQRSPIFLSNIRLCTMLRL